MGKSHLSAIRLQEFSRITRQHLNRPKRQKPMSESRSFQPEIAKLVSASSSTEQFKSKSENPEREIRTPLSEVVNDCVKRWFQDTLKEAKAGDISMQVLVGQMYYSGYGVPRDAQKGRAWITKASRSRSSVWKVYEKRPGYNASDSDSDEVKDEVK